MTDAEKADRLARVLWWGYWCKDFDPTTQPPTWDFLSDEAKRDWLDAACAALTWLDSLGDGND